MTPKNTSDIATATELAAATDAACERYVHDLAAISPTNATAWGIPGHEGELEDFSPEYYEKVAQRTRELLAETADDESVSAKVLRDRLGLELELHEAGEDIRALNNIASPVQQIRDIFSLMAPDEEAIASRLSRIPAALAGYRESLSLAASQGKVAAQRQVALVAKQCRDLARPDSVLASFGVSADAAQQAFGELAEWLEAELAPRAPEADAVGRERYQLFSKYFVGAEVDLDESYEWGQQRLQGIIAEQEAIAAELYGAGTSVEEAMRRLDSEERYTIHGTEALREWMQETADKVIAELNGVHFDIPEPVRRIEAMIDPAGTGGIFYTAPSDDFSRPGRMWWSVPAGQEEFHTWQELTTVFHEAVPGHHLQCGQAIAERDNLNLWRRVACWNSGHGEGWALYAEQLMAELGYHEDPGTRMGLLDAQRLRAARVILDIGVHLGKPGWDADYAGRFLRANSAMDDANLRFELNRYLGWPGQAPSYALGQRLWEELRRDCLAQGMELKEFHTRALSYGSIPMSIMREELEGVEKQR